MSTVLHIAPQLPPAVDGVGDYCWHLWRHWPESTSEWAFASMGDMGATRLHWPEARVHPFCANAKSLRQALDASGAEVTVLHYVGYGYNPKGVPLWLPKALGAWRERTDGRLVTMFHEMYADSTPFRSPFWVKPWARHVIRSLVEGSDAWITSCERYFAQLTNEFGAPPDAGARIPIGSNVPAAPELSDERLWPLGLGRKLRIAVFGLPNTRLRALRSHAGLLGRLNAAGLVDSILLIGKDDRTPQYAKTISACQRKVGGEWRSLMDLPPMQVAETLSECDVGLVANEPDTLTKSGVFAALATNGVVSIVSSRAAIPVPAPFNECVLLNDGESFEEIVSELRGSNRMTARRRTTLRAARLTLSWHGVASAFRSAMESTRRARTLRGSPASMEGSVAMDGREVGA